MTAHNPAFGTREYEKTYATGRVLERIGRYKISDWMIDGNHVSVVGDEAVWKRQLKLLGGYAAFYNPWNLLRALRHDRSRLRRWRIGYQALGFIATLWTAVKVAPYIARLMVGRLVCYVGPPRVSSVPVRSPAAAFPRLPTGTPQVDSVSPDQPESRAVAV